MSFSGRQYSSVQRKGALFSKPAQLVGIKHFSSGYQGMSEIVISCSDGLQLAAKYWPSKETTNCNDASFVQPPKIVCLHGWLDNAASFHMVAPTLNSRGDVLALDFPGHGHSGHKSPDGPTNLISEYALYLSETLESMSWIKDEPKESEGVILVGHSMGAGVALIYAATFPEYASRVVLLDGAGPLARNLCALDHTETCFRKQNNILPIVKVPMMRIMSYV